MSVAPRLPAPLLDAWLEQSSDLLAVTDRRGHLTWANARFVAATGLAPAPGAQLLSLAPDEPPHAGARAQLCAVLEGGTIADADLELRAAGAGRLWVRAHAVLSGEQVLWTLQDTTALRKLSLQASRQAELLDMAQEFGRL